MSELQRGQRYEMEDQNTRALVAGVNIEIKTYAMKAWTSFILLSVQQIRLYEVIKLKLSSKYLQEVQAHLAGCVLTRETFLNFGYCDFEDHVGTLYHKLFKYQSKHGTSPWCIKLNELTVFVWFRTCRYQLGPSFSPPSVLIITNST
ncbi:hypothetical protein ATANTOWER_017666 [Ataeniobius toweri]|uniref:Uncharacterized protein n=1 Tax=Ataeniobius toweri TaxID=208326 RepID=A0ABU7B1D5_9TELE|nr:hypothetical protein [Ataeniobius toweri]